MCLTEAWFEMDVAGWSVMGLKFHVISQLSQVKNETGHVIGVRFGFSLRIWRFDDPFEWPKGAKIVRVYLPSEEYITLSYNHQLSTYLPELADCQKIWNSFILPRVKRTVEIVGHVGPGAPKKKINKKHMGLICATNARGMRYVEGPRPRWT